MVNHETESETTLSTKVTDQKFQLCRESINYEFGSNPFDERH
jgi:hypothetical protein